MAPCATPRCLRRAVLHSITALRGGSRGAVGGCIGDTAMLLAVAALMSSSPACSSVMASPFEPSELPPPRSARCASLSPLQFTDPARCPVERGPQDEKREAPSHQAAAAAAAAAAAQHVGSRTTSEAVTLSAARRFRMAPANALAIDRLQHLHDATNFTKIGWKVWGFSLRTMIYISTK